MHTTEQVQSREMQWPVLSGDVITVIRDPKRPLGKHFALDAEGKVVKCPQVETSFCYARMVRVPDHATLAKLLAQVAEDEHLAVINSQFKGVEVGERFIILSEAEIERRYGVKGREQTAAKQTVETPATGWGGKLGDRVFRTVRSRSGMAAMFANVTNAMQQITGLSIAALKVKPAHLKAATWRYLRAPSEVAEQVAQLSTFMANRQSNEVQQMRSDIEALLLNPSACDKAQAWTAKHAYFLQSAFQNVVDNITWTAAFDQALAEGHNQDEAVRAANAAVRETQGSLQPEDISRFESGPAFARLFTQFQSYFNMQANILGTEFAKVTQDMGLKKGAGRLFYVFLLGFLVPAWFSETIVQAMRGGPDDDDHDGYLDEFLAFFFGAPLRNIAAMTPFVGQIGMVTYNSFNRKPYDDRMSTAPAVSMIESAASAPHSIYKAIADDGSTKRAIRDTLTLISIATGIPVAALGKPLGYIADVEQSKVRPRGQTLEPLHG